MNLSQVAHKRHAAPVTVKVDNECVCGRAEVYGYWANKEDAGYHTGWHWHWIIKLPKVEFSRYDIENSSEPYRTKKAAVEALERILKGHWIFQYGNYSWFDTEGRNTLL